MHFFQRLFLPCGKFVHFSRADGKNFDMMGMAVEKNSKHMRRYRLLLLKLNITTLQLLTPSITHIFNLQTQILAIELQMWLQPTRLLQLKFWGRLYGYTYFNYIVMSKVTQSFGQDFNVWDISFNSTMFSNLNCHIIKFNYFVDETVQCVK